jgi:hypothetical protein
VSHFLFLLVLIRSGCLAACGEVCFLSGLFLASINPGVHVPIPSGTALMLCRWLGKGSNRPVGARNGLRRPWVACWLFYGLIARLKPSACLLALVEWLCCSLLRFIS